MKKILLGMALTVLASAIYAQSTPKMAVVDLRGVMQGYTVNQSVQKERAEKESDLKALQEEKMAALKEKENEIVKLQQTLTDEASAVTLSESKKEEIKTEIQEKYQAFEESRQESARDLYKEENDIKGWLSGKMGAIQADFDEVVKEICEERSIDLLLNSGATLFADDSLDITADVIQRLNAKAAAEAAGANN